MRAQLSPGRLFSAVLFVCLASAGSHAQSTGTPPQPKAQTPADVRAYRAALQIADPAGKRDALEQFVRDYPKSSRVSSAQSALLKVLLKSFLERADEIDAQAKNIVKRAGKGYVRVERESDVAMQLADAGPHGTDLKLADRVSSDALKNSSEDKLSAEFAAMSRKYGTTATPADVRTFYAEIRCEALAARADVKLAQGKADEAVTLLHEADVLNPRIDDVKAIEGRVALERRDSAQALDDFEQAELVGSLDKPWRDKAAELYKQAHGGSDAQWTADMDHRYAELFPEPFAPGTHPAPSGGHTVLLQLFTGSGCEPCVAADLAMEGVLQSYPRTEVVALAFDQHIPRPDPLSIPEGVERGSMYSIPGTPTYVLDGAVTTLGGGRRYASEKLYKQLTGLVDQQASTLSSVQLQLTATAGADGAVQAEAVVTAPDREVIAAQIARKIVIAPPPDPSDPKPPPPAKTKTKAKKAATPSATTSPAPKAPAAVPEPPPGPALVVRFALVEDDVRYSGENGIRFHRMVVRSLPRPEGDKASVAAGASSTVHASFQQAEVSRKLSEYLDSYEKTNDRFGAIEFLSKETSLDPAHLAVAAWVEDTTSHRVLQAAFVPLGASGTGGTGAGSGGR